MSEFLESELFSAYLDGELTADEQVRVEQVLATSPEARQMLDELRTLGCTLQSLPQQKLSENLAERVLEIAKRRVLAPNEPDKNEEPDKSDKLEKPSAGRAAAALTTPAADTSASEGFPWRELSWRGMFTPRALVWSALIVIAGIIIHFNAPQPIRDVARLDDNQATAGPAPSGDRAGGQATSDGSWDKPKLDGASKKQGESSMVAKANKESAASDETADGKPGSEMAKRKAAEPLSPVLPAAAPMLAEASPAPPAAKPAEKPAAGLALSSDAEFSDAKVPAGKTEERNFKFARRGTVQSKSAGRMQEEASEKAKDASTELAEGMHGLKKEIPVEEKKMALQDSVVRNEPAPSGPMTPAPAVAAPPVTGLLSAAMAPASPPLPPAEVVKHGYGPGSGQGIMVVRLNCSTEAARSRVFNELLAKNGLTVKELPELGRRELAKSEASKGDGSLAAEQTNGTTLNGGSYGSMVQKSGAGQLQLESIQNGASRAAAIAPRRAVTSASEAQIANAPQAMAAPAADQPQIAQQDRGAASDVENRTQALNNTGSSVLYYDCDASPEQLTSLMKQIGQRRDAFSAPQVSSSFDVQQAERYRYLGQQGSSAYNYAGNDRDQLRVAQNDDARKSQDQNKQVAAAKSDKASEAGESSQPAQAKQAKSSPESLSTDKLGDAAKPQGRGGGVSGGQLYYQSAASTASAPVTGKTHVRFVLSVVDHVAPPLAPAPAATVPEPAKGK